MTPPKRPPERPPKPDREHPLAAWLPVSERPHRAAAPERPAPTVGVPRRSEPIEMPPMGRLTDEQRRPKILPPRTPMQPKKPPPKRR